MQSSQHPTNDTNGINGSEHRRSSENQSPPLMTDAEAILAFITGAPYPRRDADTADQGQEGQDNGANGRTATNQDYPAQSDTMGEGTANDVEGNTSMQTPGAQ